MNIKFDRIIIKNFLSFGEEEIDLSVTGYTLVQGVNENSVDNSTSNGSGKSTIFEALCWCLCGETIRGSKDVVNMYSDNGAYVEVIFSSNDTVYKVIRTKGYKPLGNSIQFFVNGEDKSGKGVKETEKVLNEYLPDLTSSLIGSVIILGQGLPQRFSNNTPSGRKDILEKLSKSDFMILDLKDRIAKRKQVLQSDIRKVEDDLLSVKSKKDVLTKQIEQEKSSLESLSSLNIDDLTAELNNYESRIITLNNDNDKYDENIRAKQAEKKSYEDSIFELRITQDNEIEALKNDCGAVIDELRRRKVEKTAEKHSLEKSLREMKSIKDVCPTCGQKLLNVVKPDTSEIETEIKNIDVELVNIETELNDKTIDFNAKKKIIDDDFIQKKNTIQKCLDNVLDSIDKLNTDRSFNADELQHANSEINALTVKINSINNDKLRIENKIDELNIEIKSLDDSVLYNNNELEKLNNHLEVISKMSTVITRDFRGCLLSTVIEYIKNRAKMYSMDVFDNDKIDFYLDGNNIIISYNAKCYENLSGGERQKVDLIVQFAIRDMLKTYCNFNCNILVVDELFDNLDSKGCENVLNLISKRLVDVESVYIVTHHASIPIPFDNIITVVKGESGISRIKH